MFWDNVLVYPPRTFIGSGSPERFYLFFILDVACILICIIKRNTLFAALLAIGTAFGAPMELSERVFDLRHKLAVFHHVGVTDGDGFMAPRLRFAHLVPKDSYQGSIADGFACAALGHKLKQHKFLFVDSDETLVELLGFSDCKNWFIALLGFWTPYSLKRQYKFYSGLRGKKFSVLGTLDELVDFAHLQIHYVHNQAYLFGRLVKKGLTAHILTHKLNARLAPALETYGDRTNKKLKPP
ncbi:hypothetical protein MACK_001186 [Theileria orientalis]|uniref:Uncharacterized protein n=1 Tax=Theileria orientalis TaxID=68886 RepID=A0A976MCG7_THEOR|nr:hypothetical protein MACK_001186 [Theileria orientalis]